MIVKGIYNGGERQIAATKENELIVRAIVETELEHSSSNGRAYSWVSLNADIDVGDTILFVKNTSDKFLVLSRAEFTVANVVCNYDIGVGSETTAPTGTAITAVNWNQRFSTTTEDYVAYHDETAVADATPMISTTVSTTEGRTIMLDGVILGKNDYIQINQETESTSGRVTLIGHFEDETV